MVGSQNGKSTRRKHAQAAGADWHQCCTADILLETFTLNTPTNGIGEDLEPITAEEIEAEFSKLSEQAFARKDGDGKEMD